MPKKASTSFLSEVTDNNSGSFFVGIFDHLCEIMLYRLYLHKVDSTCLVGHWKQPLHLAVICFCISFLVIHKINQCSDLVLASFQDWRDGDMAQQKYSRRGIIEVEAQAFLLCEPSVFLLQGMLAQTYCRPNIEECSEPVWPC